MLLIENMYGGPLHDGALDGAISNFLVHAQNVTLLHRERSLK